MPCHPKPSFVKTSEGKSAYGLRRLQLSFPRLTMNHVGFLAERVGFLFGSPLSSQNLRAGPLTYALPVLFLP